MSYLGNSLISRRNLLRRSLLCGTAWGFQQVPFEELLALGVPKPRGDSSLLGVVPFSDEGHPPMGKLMGSELDGRLLTDISSLTPENPLTQTDSFFVRTSASKLLDTSKGWTIQIGGEVDRPLAIPIDVLARESRPMGVHLLECSGNARTAHFGLLSIATWDGVPLQEILDRIKPRTSDNHVLVSGFDRYQEESMTSDPGASWIFTPEQLFSSRAFLATKMNGKPLSPDHGAPVRLVVPGWYGCVCIKWVNQVDYVPDDVPPTSQMQEYASRTMQAGVPSLAREYRPAVIQPAAMPTRIEKWRTAKKTKYRVMGIQWGGRISQTEIEIRFNQDERFVPIANFRSEPGCGFWRYDWSPPKTGKFTIRLRLNQANAATTRLSSGYYDRAVEITEI